MAILDNVRAVLRNRPMFEYVLGTGITSGPLQVGPGRFVNVMPKLAAGAYYQHVAYQPNVPNPEFETRHPRQGFAAIVR
jgi:hypothetical protein